MNRILTLLKADYLVVSVVTALSLFHASSAFGATKEVGPGDDLEAAMNDLAPGDELVLRGGTYALDGRFAATVEGTQAMPIVIRAKAGEKPHVTRASADHNIIELVKARFVTIRGIEFSGGSHGLRLMNVSDTVIEECEIHDTGDVAISANSGGKYARVSLLRNHIHHTNGTGEAMYLGCNNNACQFHDGVIAGNYIHHTNGPTVAQGDGIEIKEGSYGNVVRDNVIHDTNYPCILTYSTVGNGPPNVLERNLLFRCGDHGIQAAADVIIRNNVILSAAVHGIANQPHQAGTPSNIQIVHNTVFSASKSAIASTGITGSVVIANNALYAPKGSAISVKGALAGVVVQGNVGVGTLQGITTGLTLGNLAKDFVGANFSGTVPNDVFPKDGSTLIGAGAVGFVTIDDFNGAVRGGAADVGAYKYATGANPGWALAEAFKPAVLTPPPSAIDGGSADGGASIPSAPGTPGTVPGAGTPEATNGQQAEGGAKDTSSGCACRTSRVNDESNAFALGVAGVLLLLGRRRARGSARASATSPPMGSGGFVVACFALSCASEDQTSSDSLPAPRDPPPASAPSAVAAADAGMNAADASPPPTDAPTNGGCYAAGQRPPTEGPSGFAIPDRAAERDAYLRFGWTIDPGADADFPAKPGYAIANPDVHGDVESDDLWTNIVMFLRTNQPGYLDRAKAWARYFKEDYTQCVGGAYEDLCYDRDAFGLDHLAGWGLLAYAAAQNDPSAVDAAERIGEQVDGLWGPSSTHGCLPTSGCLGYGLRGVGRHLLFMTRLAEVTGKPKWQALRDRIIDTVLSSTMWNATHGFYFLSEWSTDSFVGAGKYQAGMRIQSTFQVGVLTEAMDHAYRTTGNEQLRTRMVEMARFVAKHGLDPTYQYAGSTFGVNGAGATVHNYALASPVTYWDPVYTTSLVNTLMRGYRYTCEPPFLDAAKKFFIRGNGGLHREPVLRSVPDGVVHHFVDTRLSTSSGNVYFDFNKGELQYTYLLFEP